MSQIKAPVVSDLFTSLVVKKPVFNVSIPVLRDGELRFVMSLGMLPDDLVPLLAAQKFGPEWVTMIWGREWRNPSPFTRQRALPCHGVAEEFARAGSASHRPGDQFGWHRRASRNGEVADFWLGCRGQRPIRID